MKLFLYILFVILSFSSCANMSSPIKKINTRDDSISRAIARKDSIRTVDSQEVIAWHSDILKNIHEPGIFTLHTQSYRLYYNFYLTKFFIFSMIYYEDKTILYSKSVSLYLNDTTRQISKVVIFDSTIQLVSKEQADSFKSLVNKVDYWNIPVPKFPGIRDGDFTNFESYSRWKDSDTLSYHALSFLRIPNQLKPAWGYLIKISGLNQKYKDTLYDMLVNNHYKE